MMEAFLEVEIQKRERHKYQLSHRRKRKQKQNTNKKTQNNPQKPAHTKTTIIKKKKSRTQKIKQANKQTNTLSCLILYIQKYLTHSFDLFQAL